MKVEIKEYDSFWLTLEPESVEESTLLARLGLLQTTTMAIETTFFDKAITTTIQIGKNRNKSFSVGDCYKGFRK